MGVGDEEESGLLWAPGDRSFRANPYPFYARLRSAAPAYAAPGGAVVLSRYDDVMATLRSEHVSHDLDANAKAEDIHPITRRPLRGPRRRRGSTKTILNLDPPDHTRLRGLVSMAFTPAAIERLRPRIEALVDGVLDGAAASGEIELVEDLAFPIPFRVISELLDMPTERADDLRDWSRAISAALEPAAADTDLDEAETAARDFVPYLVDVIEERRSRPGPDLLSGLLAAEADGQTLSPQELISFVVLLYVAGHETTVSLIGNGLAALLEHRDELARWRRDPTLDAVAVDELLRFDGPLQHTVRVAMKAMRFRGRDGEAVVAEPGRTIVTLLGAANRDPEVFEDPDRLWLGRPNASAHAGFGAGIHYCLGASLARLEATLAITRLIRRFETIELQSPPRWRDRITIRGVERLELKLA
jgi:cytochrome P450